LQGAVLREMVVMLRPRRILELGCCSGYSALWMASGAKEVDGTEGIGAAEPAVVTCEVDADVAEFARENIARCGYSNMVDVVTGRADATLDRLGAAKQQFDFIFVDADKGGYAGYLNQILALGLLARHGVIVFDNTLFRGQVLGEGDGVVGGTKAGRRGISGKLARFNEALAADERVVCSVLPMFDGMTVVRHAKMQN
ncbi:S-adenosyl-L-methionine-dependent methyltransferase, partial [Ramicandelaber brevisporus]